MAASRSLEEEETLRGRHLRECAHPAELVAGRTLELRAQIQKSWTDEQFEIPVESRRGPATRRSSSITTGLAASRPEA